MRRVPASISTGSVADPNPKPDPKPDPGPNPAALIVSLTPAEYIQALQRLKALKEREARIPFFGFFGSTKDLQSKKEEQPTKVSVYLDDQPKEDAVSDYYARIEYANHSVKLEYFFNEAEKSGVKISSEEKAATTKENLIAQYLKLAAVSLRFLNDVQKNNKEFKLVFIGPAPEHEKLLSREELISALKDFCAANNVFAANFWGYEDWENKQFQREEAVIVRPHGQGPNPAAMS